MTRGTQRRPGRPEPGRDEPGRDERDAVDAATTTAPRSSPSRHPVERLQRSIGNRATTQLLRSPLAPIQREEGDYSFLSSTVNFFTGSGDLVQAAAEAALPNVVNVRCIRHYRAGSGQPLRFSAAEVQTMAVHANVFNFPKVQAAQAKVMAELSRRRAASDAANPDAAFAGFHREPSTVGLEERFDDAVGLCGTGGLGTATMHATGVIRYTTAGWEIEGTYTLYDRWDFDLDRWRGAMLSAQTTAGRLFLPGRPFDVHTDPVPFRTTTWSGNVIEHGNGRANAATSQR